MVDVIVAWNASHIMSCVFIWLFVHTISFEWQILETEMKTFPSQPAVLAAIALWQAHALFTMCPDHDQVNRTIDHNLRFVDGRTGCVRAIRALGIGLRTNKRLFCRLFAPKLDGKWPCINDEFQLSATGSRRAHTHMTESGRCR